MGAFIDTSGQLLNDRSETLALCCPHCQVLAHITPIAVPGFNELNTHRPKAVGVVFRCDACYAAVFLRFPVKIYGPQRIELSAQIQEVERLEERFSYSHLPDDVALLFREALACFAHNQFNAFASMCQRTMQAAYARMSEANRLWVQDQLAEACRLADIDDVTFADVKRVINGPELPTIDQTVAGALIEIMKDLLYQVYVRRGRLQQAMSVRRFFSEESLRGLRVTGSS
jgi:hypothetical protein